MRLPHPRHALPALLAGLGLALLLPGPAARAVPIEEGPAPPPALDPSAAPALPSAADAASTTSLAPRTQEQEDPEDETEDMLGGKRRLVDVRDLVVLREVPDDRENPSFYEVAPVVLKTADGTIQSEEVWGQDISPCVPKVPDLWPYPYRLVAGRFYDTPSDMFLSVNGANGSTEGTCLASYDAAFRLYEKNRTDKIYASVKTMRTRFFQLAVHDFDEDGFDDVFVVNDEVAFVASAADVRDPEAGLRFHSHSNLPSDEGRPIGSPAVGDFNGDELSDVAWLEVPGSCNDFADDCVVEKLEIHVATVCPGPVAGTICEGKDPMKVLKSPASASLIDVVINDPAATLGPQCVPAAALAAGRFGDESTSLAVAYSFKPVESNHCMLRAEVLAFDSELRATERSSTDIDYLQEPLTVYAEPARLDWFSGQDQLVIAAGGHRNRENIKHGSFLAVVDFDADQQMSSTLETSTDDSLLAGLAVGSFAEPSYDETTTPADFGPQIAVLVERNGGNSRRNRVRIYRALPVEGRYQILLGSTTDYTAEGSPSDFTHNYGGSRLAAVDLQGRSVVLGAPVVYEVSTSLQPNVVLGAPPMHADFVQPVASTSEEPTLVNFSVLPSSFKSQYQTSTSSETSSSNTKKTSWTLGTSLEIMLASKSPGLLYGTTSEKKLEFSADYTHEEEKEVKKYSSSSQEYDATTKTALGDQVWFTRTGMRFFNYPVIGERACPEDDPGCAEPGPVYFVLSLPVDTTFATSNASGLEWYQPVHETGNVFSYPWDYAQLVERVGDIDLLSTETPTTFYTDESVREVEVSWKQAQGKEVTTGVSNEFESSLTYTYSAQTAGYSKSPTGVKGKVAVGVSGGGAWSSVKATDSVVASSTGFGIEKESTFQTPTLYQYLIQPYIFGEPATPKELDPANLDTDISTNGVLNASFVANPLGFGSGSWWASSPYAKSFDVGLSHPARWKLDPSDYVSGRLPPMCLYKVEVRTTADCVHLNQPEEDLWNSEFHWMKGLFITTGEDLGDTRDPGSQRSIVLTGDRVTVRARVYNFSLKDMGDARTMARIYRQEWNESTGEPEGPSVLLAEQDLGAIPAFAQGTDPNHVMASASFEATQDMEGKQYVFWVVTWAESADGSLAAELPGHGLARLPGDLTDLRQVDLEEVSFTDRLGQPVTQTISNNVGLFRQLVTVVPYTGEVEAPALLGADAQDAAAGLGAGRFQVGLEEPAIEVRDIELSQDVAALGETVFVSADVHAIGASTAGVPVDFFDGDPHDGGTLYDVEMLSWIHGHRPHRVSAPFRPQTCGTHELYVVAEPDTDRRVHESATLVVPCDDTPAPRGGRIYLPAAWRDAPAGPARD